MRNRSHLLGNGAGVDGIKTGFSRASGFNLVASVRRGNRHLVAVVMGGNSAGSRDARMRALIEEYVSQGATERTAARIVEAPAQAQVKPLTVPVIGLQLPRAQPPIVDPARPEAPAEPIVTSRMPPTTTQTAEARAQIGERPHVLDQPRPGSAEPITAIRVKTLAVRAANTPQNAAMAALPAAGAPPAPLPPAPVHQYQTASAASVPAPVRTGPAPEPAVAQNAPPVAKRGGWVIQIGAFPDETEARERLQSAQSMAKSILAHADAFTERVTKGRETLYRARFAGLDEDSADAACRHFKRNKIDCFAVKN